MSCILLLVCFDNLILLRVLVNLVLFFCCIIWWSLSILKFFFYNELYIDVIELEIVLNIGFWVIGGSWERLFIVKIDILLKGLLDVIIFDRCLWIVYRWLVLIMEILLIIKRLRFFSFVCILDSCFFDSLI